MMAELRELVEKYERNRNQYVRSDAAYKEIQTRQEFIDPLLRLLGWDVENKKGAPLHLREVIHGTSVEAEEESGQLPKEPDYGLRVAGKRKLFVEAKKPSVHIERNKQPAFQLRRYGWTARLPVSVLTNFEHLVIYDCRFLPKPEDDVRVARLKIYSYNEYVQKFDEIYEQLSRESVYSGRFDKVFDVEREIEGTQPFDDYFLRQIEGWREALAKDLATRNPSLAQDTLNFLVQRLINRIVFLRICEDRELEKYKRLQKVESYDELKELFLKTDKRYNSGLFDFVEDQLSLDVEVGSDNLIQIFQELYYPESPYAFSVMDATVLGEIYELFLGKEVRLGEGRKVEIEDKPEAVESGVIPTPSFIVDYITDQTVASACDGKTPDHLSSLHVADIACGSGTFLLAAYEHLLNYHREWYLKDGSEKHKDKLYRGPQDQWYLTLREKQRILLNNIFGVDIDIQAAEVTRFSLLLKTLENETAATIKDHLERHRVKALPNLSDNIQCGNSLVDTSSYLKFNPDGLDDENLLRSINPLDWRDAFPEIFKEGGFDIIVGNPPYIRIQNMVKYTPEEVSFYQSGKCPYETSKSDNFDKYALFIERAVSLLTEDGVLGYIVPHKFTKIKSGKALRKLISEGKNLRCFVDFGVQQVFHPRSTTYTCILILGNAPAERFVVEHVPDLSAWKYERRGVTEEYNADDISEEPWVFLPPSVKELFGRLNQENPATLESVANIFVGVQTSADEIYIFRPEKETDNYIHFTDKDGTPRKVEKAIVRPSLLDAPLECFGTPKANTYIIFPYKVKSGRAIVYTPREMQENFPECWKYLQDYRDELIEDRSIQGGTPETWYRFGRSQSLTKFDGRDKLIWPILSLEPRYVHDDHNILFTGGGNGPYYALRPKDDSEISIHYLQAVLSHPVFEAMVEERSSKFRGGYYSHGKQFIKDLPIKLTDENNKGEAELYKKIVSLTTKLIDVTAKWEKAQTPQTKTRYQRLLTQLRKKLDETIEEFYEVNKEDVGVLEELSRKLRGVEEE